ncbi:MAG: hypothetical protein BGO43_04620 [Gammaproteobacteria bacterium 39-13]|nr:bifunctional folylpolyglutamate synthase/dihydrofolate synthase [Gammaproteobacteria bacterium]OJV94956.1 MAG: hypothetical protein BGO43_04620 [Gammaproteobacteria bacterium 39-13]
MSTKDHFDLEKWLAYLEQSHPLSIELGLDRIREVGERGRLFQFPFPVVTVAGTNGKGSTVSALSKLLREAGLNVGTYTSPHLLRFNERIQINGECVSDAEICQAFRYIEALRINTSLTFFEFTTLAAFYIFRHSAHALDIVILEVGLGGRLDAVNVIDPSLAIVTSIGYDHQEYLGDTLEAIAFEKSGIFRPKIPILLSKKAKISTLLERALILGNPLVVEGEHFDYEQSKSRWRYGNKVFKLPRFYLPPTSVSLAMAAYTLLGENHFSLPPLCEVIDAFANVMMVGRYQQVEVDGIKVIFDVGHNEDASHWLTNQLRSLNLQGKIIAVWASLSDKALSAIVAPMKQMVSTWCIGELVGVKRAASTQMLQAVLREQGIEDILAHASIEAAFTSAQRIAKAGDSIVIFGSFYTVSQVLEKFPGQNKTFQDNGLFCCDVTRQAS